MGAMPTNNIGDPLRSPQQLRTNVNASFRSVEAAGAAGNHIGLDSRQGRITSCSSAPWRKVQVSLHDLAMAAQTAIAKGPVLPLADKGSRCDTASLDSVTKRPCLRV